ncbi:hypothetical protein B0H11DRAFT_2266683 [Mycena galericulata]|nr:hypothetical protein B0H11DRAFT_2266683 [Mycena galericulata]
MRRGKGREKKKAGCHNTCLRIVPAVLLHPGVPFLHLASHSRIPAHRQRTPRRRWHQPRQLHLRSASASTTTRVPGVRLRLVYLSSLVYLTFLSDFSSASLSASHLLRVPASSSLPSTSSLSCSSSSAFLSAFLSPLSPLLSAPTSAAANTSAASTPASASLSDEPVSDPRVVATIGWPPVDRRVVDQRRVAVTGQHAAGAGQLPRGDDGYPPIINTRSPPAECSLDFFSPLSSLPPPPSSSASVIRLRGLPDCCRASTSASAPVSARLRHRASTSAPPISSRSRVPVRGDHSTASSRPSSRRATAGAAKARSRWAGAAAAPPPRSRTRASSSSTRSGHRPVAFVFAVPRIEHRIQPSLVDSGEGYITVDGNTGDCIRMNITLWHGGEALIAATAAACANTIVVQHVVGPVLVTD